MEIAFSALALLLGGRKGIRPVKTEWWGAGVVICLERGADLHMAQLMPLPLTVSCFSKIQIGFTFLVLAFWYCHPDKGPLNGRVCVLLAWKCVVDCGSGSVEPGQFRSQPAIGSIQPAVHADTDVRSEDRRTASGDRWYSYCQLPVIS